MSAKPEIDTKVRRVTPIRNNFKRIQTQDDGGEIVEVLMKEEAETNKILMRLNQMK